MKNILLAYSYGKNVHTMTDDDIRMLDGINLAFGNVKDDAFADPDFGWDLSVIAHYKEVNPKLYVTVSMGGAGRSGYSTAAKTQKGREKLARTTIEFVRKWNLDGVDLDWEFPCHPELGVDGCPEDRENYPLLVKEFRTQLDAVEKEDGKHYLLTIAAGSCEDFLKCTKPEEYLHLLDYVQIMTYDMRVQKAQFEVPPETVLSGHHTCLYTKPGDELDASVDASVKIYERWGVPAEKIIIGSAFYTRVWPNVGDKNNGLFQHSDNPDVFGPHYDALTRDYINKNGYVRYWDDDAKAPYLYNGNEFISYDDPESIREKCKYLKEQGLLGIMFWEYGCDDTHTLLKAHYDALK